MRAKIFQPARTAMSSGTAKTNGWILEFDKTAARKIDPLMGWTSSSDTRTQIRLSFDTLDEAKEYAERNGVVVTIMQPKKRAQNIRQGGYGENFATNRRGVWTH